MKQTKGDKVRIVMNEYVTDCESPFHYYELGEIVRVVRVSPELIYCINSSGLVQALKPTHIEPINKIN